MTALLVGYPLFKGVITAVTVVAVLVFGTSLGVFVQGLIIAVVSAAIGAGGMVIAARIAAESARQTMDVAHQNRDALARVESAIGNGGHDG